MKNAEVEKIRHWSALVGQLGRSKKSCGHLKLILCCSLPDIIPKSNEKHRSCNTEGDITWRNIGVYSDDDIDEAGRRLCSLGADIQSRSTPGDRL